MLDLARVKCAYASVITASFISNLIHLAMVSPEQSLNSGLVVIKIFFVDADLSFLAAITAKYFPNGSTGQISAIKNLIKLIDLEYLPSASLLKLLPFLDQWPSLP